jgi:hypothetical protein
MKSLILAASMVLSVSAFANTITDYSEVLGAIKLNNACVTDTQVKSINAVNVCTHLEARTSGDNAEGGVVTNWVCTAWDMKDLAYPRAFEKTVCLKNAPIDEAHAGECLKFGKKADFLPATIKTLTVETNGEATTETRGSFTFPACK